MVVNNIPFEIAKRVVENLNHQDLKECLLTCKVLNRAASDSLRETICFPKPSTLEHFKSIIMDRITTSSNTARRVKHIDVQGLFRDNHFSEQQHLSAKIVLKTIYKCCPNIETISYGPLGSPGDIDFWAPTLTAITEDGYLQHLNAIPSLVRDAKTFESYYLPIAYAIKSKLKCIYIRSVESKRDDIDCLPLIFETPFNGGDPWLAQFPQLETFDFSWWWGSISLSDINAMVDCCSKSKHFNTLLLGVNTESTSFGLSQLFILPCRQVKKIKYYREQPIDDNSMIFFMRKFPELNDVNIKIEMAKRGSSNHLSDSVLSRFLRHLSLVPTIDFTIDLDSEDAGYCLALLLENSTVNDIKVEFELSFLSTSIHFVSQEEEKSGVCKLTFHNPPRFSNYSQDIPYYYECLRKVEKKMKAFTLKSSCKYLLDNKSKNNRYPIRIIMEHSKLYNSLLGYLLVESRATLSTLNIIGLDYVWLSIRNRQNLFIKELTLQNVTFITPAHNDEFLKVISKSLPNLEYLLLDCSVIEKGVPVIKKSKKKKTNYMELFNNIHNPFLICNEGVPLPFIKQLTIDMPYTSFRVFGWGIEDIDSPYRVEDRYSEIYLKVVTKNSGDLARFFVVKDDQISCLSELDHHYGSLVSDDRSLALEIRCKKLDFFRLKLIDSDTTFEINL